MTVIALEKLPVNKHKHRDFTELANWFSEMSNAVFSLQKYKAESKRFLIVPEIMPKGEEETIAELFYRKRGDRLGKIELVELRKDGALVLPIGPIEKKSVIPQGTIWKKKSKEG